MGRRRDAGLSVGVLLVVLAVCLAVGAPPTAVPLAVGAAGALVVEAVTQLRPATVRRVWDRPAVQVGAVATTLAAAGLGLAVVGPAALWVLVGGLTAYLALLAAVATLARRRRSREG